MGWMRTILLGDIGNRLDIGYKQREASGRISHPSVCFVKEGSYAELEQVMYEAKKKNGVSYGQIKVPTMLKAEGHDQWIEFLQSRRVQV